MGLRGEPGAIAGLGTRIKRLLAALAEVKQQLIAVDRIGFVDVRRDEGSLHLVYSISYYAVLHAALYTALRTVLYTVLLYYVRRDEGSLRFHRKAVSSMRRKEGLLPPAARIVVDPHYNG